MILARGLGNRRFPIAGVGNEFAMELMPWKTECASVAAGAGGANVAGYGKVEVWNLFEARSDSKVFAVALTERDPVEGQGRCGSWLL